LAAKYSTISDKVKIFVFNMIKTVYVNAWMVGGSCQWSLKNWKNAL